MVNNSVYLYGFFSDGYTQYPDDYAREVYYHFYVNVAVRSQLIIHRDNNLMYYGYYQKLDHEKQFVGFCVLLNGVMITQFDRLFSIFENAVANLVTNGEILHFSESGNIISTINNLNEKKKEVERITAIIRNDIQNLGNNAQKLPPVNYASSVNDNKFFTLKDNVNEIIDASCKSGYTYILKNNDYKPNSINSYQSVLRRLNEKNVNLIRDNDDLKSTVSQLRLKQRNTLWVGVLSVVVAVLGIILYFKVINPSEVTHYQTGEFVYYGPMKNGKPHGIGVAIYPYDDKDKRKYYYGHFENGVRSDTAAMLYYQNGNYFYGHIEDTHFVNGIQYVNSSNSYFRGEFDEKSKPYNGIWYDYEEAYKIVNGKY